MTTNNAQGLYEAIKPFVDSVDLEGMVFTARDKSKEEILAKLERVKTVISVIQEYSERHHDMTDKEIQEAISAYSTSRLSHLMKSSDFIDEAYIEHHGVNTNLEKARQEILRTMPDASYFSVDQL